MLCNEILIGMSLLIESNWNFGTLLYSLVNLTNNHLMNFQVGLLTCFGIFCHKCDWLRYIENKILHKSPICNSNAIFLQLSNMWLILKFLSYIFRITTYISQEMLHKHGTNNLM